MTWKPPSSGTKKREQMPRTCFLNPSERKYPYKVKRNGKWVPSRQGLIAAKRRAAQQGDTAIEKRADNILKREFPAKDKK